MGNGNIIGLSLGVGWILGVTLAMVLVPLSYGGARVGAGEILGNLLVLSFPGFLLMMISIILIMKEEN